MIRKELGLEQLTHHIAFLPGSLGDHFLVGITLSMQEFDCDCSQGERKLENLCTIKQREVPASTLEVQ